MMLPRSHVGAATTAGEYAVQVGILHQLCGLDLPAWIVWPGTLVLYSDRQELY